jgi:hypothetical protein
MELQNFIETTLIEISNGVESAKEKTALDFRLGATPSHEKDVVNARIDFDVAVEVTEKDKSEKGGGVQIKVVRGEIGTHKESSLATTSRIKFSVEKTKNTYQRENKEKI